MKLGEASFSQFQSEYLTVRHVTQALQSHPTLSENQGSY